MVSEDPVFWSARGMSWFSGFIKTNYDTVTFPQRTVEVIYTVQLYLFLIVISLYHLNGAFLIAAISRA